MIGGWLYSCLKNWVEVEAIIIILLLFDFKKIFNNSAPHCALPQILKGQALGVNCL